MRLPLTIVVMLLLAFSATGCTAPQAGSIAAGLPPVAEKQPKTLAMHGHSRVDNYFWLRDKGDPKVMAYLHSEDDYTTSVMQPTAAFQDVLYTEIVGHIKEDDDTAPYRRGDYFYFTRTVKGLQYPIYLRKKGSPSAPEEVLVDLNELAKGHSFMAIGAFAPSDDGRLLAYSTDATGYRQYTLHVKDLSTGMLLPDQAERVGGIEWAKDNRTLFYTTEDSVTKRSDKFFRHELGSQKTDLLHEEKDELFDVSVGRSRDGDIIFLESASKTSTESRYLPAGKPTSPLTVIVPRAPNHEYDVEHRAGLFYIRTNKDAKNFRVVSAPVAMPAAAHWTELVAHRPDVKIQRLDTFANHLVLSEWENGLQQLEILDLKSRERHRVAFPEAVYAASVGPNHVFGTTTLRYNYQSLVSPLAAFDYDMTSRRATLVKRTEVPGGFDLSNYTSERVLATASDGTKVPLSLVSRKDVRRDGSAPLLLYAYGSYGASVPPTFSASRLALLDRGVIYAIAHIRGGGELGEPGRDAGRMMNKINTFTDFIASAEHLIAQKYTSPNRLVIQGGSAGGMLMGAVVNMRPDLFKAVIAEVPFVDILTTMLDATLPLTTSEYIEWGNPNDQAAYDYMAKYSPYDNVKAQAYPAMLVKVSINDSQVPYWEGAKLVAKLRATKTDSNPLLLKVNFGAGHGGASGRYDALRETAFNWAFALRQMGIDSVTAR
jgi:oligopeptidase B